MPAGAFGAIRGQGGDCPKSQTFLSENRESAFGLVYGYGVFLSREDFSDRLGGGKLYRYPEFL